MTAESKSLVERLGWHHEHPVTGKMVLVNPDGPEAAAEIDMLRNLVDERTNDAAKEWERAERLEREKEEVDARLAELGNLFSGGAGDIVQQAGAALAELARLKSPMEGAKTTAEERAGLREWCQSRWFDSSDVGLATGIMEAALDDLDHATAQARSAADDENEVCARIVEGYISDYDIEHNPSATEAFRRAAASIRARRKGETNVG